MKHGPVDVIYLVDGFNILSASVQSLEKTVEAVQEKSDGLGTPWEEHTPTGKKRAELVQAGAFYETGALGMHEALRTTPDGPEAAVRIVCVGFEGNAIGRRCDGFEGVYYHDYRMLAARDTLQKANVTSQVSGRADEALILHPLTAETVDFDTEGTPVDNSASTPDGGVAYQQVTAFSGFSGFVGTVRDSPDDVVYSDLVEFANVTSAPSAERVTVAGTVNRYLAYEGNVTGTGSITVLCIFSRN